MPLLQTWMKNFYHLSDLSVGQKVYSLTYLDIIQFNISYKLNLDFKIWFIYYFIEIVKIKT